MQALINIPDKLSAGNWMEPLAADQKILGLVGDNQAKNSFVCSVPIMALEPVTIRSVCKGLVGSNPAHCAMPDSDWLI